LGVQSESEINLLRIRSRPKTFKQTKFTGVFMSIERQPLNLNDPLLPSELPPDEKKAESLTEEQSEALKAAERLLEELRDQATPWSGPKAVAALVIALVAAGCSASSAGRFAASLFDADSDIGQNLSSSTRKGLEIATTIAAIPPSFLLSFNANLAVWNILLRSYRYTTSADVKRNILPLLFACLSSIVSFKVNWDAWKNVVLWVRSDAAAGRAVSASGTNGLFAVKMKKIIKGTRKSPEMHVILQAKARLDKLAVTHPDEYIKVMSDTHLFENFFRMDSSDPKTGVNKIVNSLLQVMEGHQLPREETRPSKARKIFQATAYSLGTASAISYLRSGSAAAELFGLKGDLALWGSGIVLGVPSACVNAAIAAIATSDAMERLASKVTNKQCTTTECVTSPVKVFFLLGYALANAGMAWNYPFPVNSKILGSVQAAINFLVYAAIGDMSFENFFNRLKNGYYVHGKDVLKNAQAACDSGKTLLEHYNSLKAASENESSNTSTALVCILKEYSTWTFNSLIDFFNNTDSALLNAILDPETIRKLELFELPEAKNPSELKIVIDDSKPTLVIEKPTENAEHKENLAPPVVTLTTEAAQRRRSTRKEEQENKGILEPPTSFSHSPAPSVNPSAFLSLTGLRRRHVTQLREVEPSTSSLSLRPRTRTHD
jgi:hypothetical protein